MPKTPIMTKLSQFKSKRIPNFSAILDYHYEFKAFFEQNVETKADLYNFGTTLASSFNQ